MPRRWPIPTPAWVNEGKVYLDVSAHFPEQDKAMLACVASDQFAA